MNEAERAIAAMERAESEWASKRARDHEYQKALKKGKQSVPIYDKPDTPLAGGTIDDWQYVGGIGKRRVRGIVSNGAQKGEILTAPIIEYDSVSGTIVTTPGNRYRLGSPYIPE